jgi:hydrogenase/urease accessory protein HupE
MKPTAILERMAKCKAQTKTEFCNYLFGFASTTELLGYAGIKPGATLGRTAKWKART